MFWLVVRDELVFRGYREIKEVKVCVRDVYGLSWLTLKTSCMRREVRAGGN